MLLNCTCLTLHMMNDQGGSIFQKCSVFIHKVQHRSLRWTLFTVSPLWDKEEQMVQQQRILSHQTIVNQLLTACPFLFVSSLTKRWVTIKMYLQHMIHCSFNKDSQKYPIPQDAPFEVNLNISYNTTDKHKY